MELTQSYRIKPRSAGISCLLLLDQTSCRPFSGPCTEEACDLLLPPCQQTAKLAQKARIFATTAPGDVVRRLALGKIRQFGRLLAIVEKLVHGNFQSPGQFLQRFDGRNRMPVFNAGDVATKQSRPLLDVPLRKFFSSRMARNRSPITMLVLPPAVIHRISNETLDSNPIGRK